MSQVIHKMYQPITEQCARTPVWRTATATLSVMSPGGGISIALEYVLLVWRESDARGWGRGERL